MTTRQQVNETAANVAKMLTMMTRMPDAQVDYLFNTELIDMMYAYSKDILKRAERMIVSVDDWYPGCGEPANGRESAIGEMIREAESDPCWNCGQPYTACGVCEHRRKE